MITHLKTKGFKGLDIDEDIPQKALFLGKNKAGKSTRAAAIALAVLGFVPFATKSSKNNADILNDYGTGDNLTVAVVCDGVEFERYFSRSSNGSVSQRLRVDKKKYSAAEFAVELSKAGEPRIININGFMSLSDQKKIDSIFELFPPKSNLKNLDEQIEKTSRDISNLQKQDQNTKAVIQRLTKSRSEIELPAGTLAEIQSEMRRIADQIKDIEQEIKSVEIEQAKLEAEEKAKAETAKPEANKDEPKTEGLQPVMSPGNRRIYDFVTGKDMKPDSEYFGPDPVESIERILDVLNDAGCGICAATIVAKQELKKFKKETVA